jgi:hypothetical protein
MVYLMEGLPEEMTTFGGRHQKTFNEDISQGM